MDLGVPSGDDNSEAVSLNNRGQIVGDSGVGFIETYRPDRALLWQRGTRFDLNTLIPADSGYHLIVAFDVNARGEIVVCAVQKSTGHVHATVLTSQRGEIGDHTESLAAEATAGPTSLSPLAKRMLEHARRMKSGSRPELSH